MTAETTLFTAQKLAQAWPLEAVPREVSAWLNASDTEPGAWLVMCSGGADSVAVLLWLWGHFPERRGDFSVLHVNHGVRGAEADADAAFVSDLAMALRVKFRVVRKEPGVEEISEAQLRHFRQEAIDAACSREAVAAIFTGHQANDVAENLLFRLARGSGLRGLSGMRPLQTRLGQPPRLRPLLLFSREEVRNRLRAAGGVWREDASNDSRQFTRNRLRSITVPAWEEAIGERDLLTGIRRSHQHLREAEAAIEDWAARALVEFAGDGLVLDALNALPLAVRRRVVARWWRRHCEAHSALSDQTIEQLLKRASESSTGRIVVGNRALESDGVRWRILPLETAVPVPFDASVWTLAPDCVLEWPGGGTLALSWRILDNELRRKICAGYFSPTSEVALEGVALPVRVRAWRPGDRYRPLGAPGGKKLQDAFTDAGIPREHRHQLPVVCDANDSILWVPGLPPNEAARITDSTSRALWLTYSGT